jgi:hypothetical protein
LKDRIVIAVLDLAPAMSRVVAARESILSWAFAAKIDKTRLPTLTKHRRVAKAC